jgi:hypothetical protein
VAFVRLEYAIQNSTLVEEVGESGHVHGIEHVDFEKDLVSDVISEERHALDQRDVANVR